jgi:hypothetical protein
MAIAKALGLATKGTISVDLGNTWYFSGEIVTGTIYVTVNEPLKCDGNDFHLDHIPRHGGLTRDLSHSNGLVLYSSGDQSIGH